jgi:hypothetical protein
MFRGTVQSHSGDTTSCRMTGVTLRGVVSPEKRMRREEAPDNLVYRGTWLIRNRHPPRTDIGPWTYSYCRVLGGHCLLGAR